MRAHFAAVVAVLVVAATGPAFADAQSHVAAAKKAEKRGEWHKALAEWKAAYASDVNAEYLIGIGDAYSHIGNKAEAKKNYEAYLADPLALPANVEKVKAKIASLESSPGDALALPGGPGLELPGASAPAALPLPGGGLDLPAPPSNTKDKGTKVAKAEPPPLPGLDLPAPPPDKQAKSEPPGLTLPGMDLPPPPGPKKETKVASAPPPLPDLPLPGAPAKTEPARPQTVTQKQPSAPPQTKVAVAPQPPVQQQPPRHVPDEALTRPPPPAQAQASSGAAGVVAWAAAGVAVVSFGGGAYAYTKASSAHSDLTGSVHSGAVAQGLIETEARNKTLSFVGLAAGLVSAGIATALFAF
ncbi:MAG TPA: hypothetical protein VLW85_14165 [Myxococcales bacterium]|nr:hypothetical protein [Myxococcales bacterium]